MREETQLFMLNRPSREACSQLRILLLQELCRKSEWHMRPPRCYVTGYQFFRILLHLRHWRPRGRRVR